MGGDLVLQSAENEGSTVTVSILAQPAFGAVEGAAGNGTSAAGADAEFDAAEAPVTAAAEQAEIRHVL